MKLTKRKLEQDIKEIIIKEDEFKIRVYRDTYTKEVVKTYKLEEMWESVYRTNEWSNEIDIDLLFFENGTLCMKIYLDTPELDEIEWNERDKYNTEDLEVKVKHIELTSSNQFLSNTHIAIINYLNKLKNN